MIIRLLIALATAFALAAIGIGAGLAASEADIWAHLQQGVTLTKVARGHRMIYTWDQGGNVLALDLDDPAAIGNYTLPENTFDSFVAFVAEQ